ncbi:MAG: hypothetical protein JWQ09_3878 [Segetibacter sp.]|nr:hypothetical protein [Segetibacter sp.]
MKNGIFTFLFISLTFFARAQDSTVALSRFEKMATSAGNFYRFEEKPIGAVRGQSVTVIKIRSFNNNDSLSAIRITLGFWETTQVIGNSILYIQKEDIGPVINSTLPS